MKPANSRLHDLVNALREASTRAAALGHDITRPGVVRTLILLHELELEPIRQGKGDARDSSGKVLEIKTASEGGACQLGQIGPGSKSLERLGSVDAVLLVWFGRTDPLRVAGAYRVDASKVAAFAKKRAGDSGIPNVAIPERWAAENGRRLKLRWQ